MEEKGGLSIFFLPLCLFSSFPCSELSFSSLFLSFCVACASQVWAEEGRREGDTEGQQAAKMGKLEEGGRSPAGKFSDQMVQRGRERGGGGLDKEVGAEEGRNFLLLASVCC